MNALSSSLPVAPQLDETPVNQANPWLGLASFTEDTRAFFFGREEEVAELVRRVQRRLLTVLFGQSGLGKTSILRAGLVPRLREQGYCPVYVRIAYDADAPAPAEQIKEAIRRSARLSGEWSQAGVAVAGESLWEFLHHRDDVLRDDAGARLTPLLIFDQFEEIFTLAQSDERGRARAATFIEELADLAENRPPKALEAALENDDRTAEKFDFARSDYRILVSLREDYLAPLESLKKSMPSIAQNRLRLAPMTGTQALAAVLRPGGRLVTEEVAAAIVRFVAGGAELSHAEVEPSLLSLICRELNDARIAQGRSEISLDLLAGSHASILGNFYERALADQPAAVRQIIEEELLTDSGFRENVAEENLLRRFKAAGAAPDTLAKLVNRRLLRIEERLDIRRVELTHDVLCGVVKQSRDQRQEREAREATERVLAEQRSRELSARQALFKARKVAAVCTVLAVLAIIAAAFAYVSSQRARRAEHEAQQTRAVAEQARVGAEQLLAYLNDDFVRELESFGRLNVLEEFAKRQIDYFHGLPPERKGIETVRNGALALMQHAKVVRYFGRLDEASRDVQEAIQLLEAQRARGDHSEATLIALALSYRTAGQIQDNRNDPQAIKTVAFAAELLKPRAEQPDASVAIRRAYADILVRKGFQEQGKRLNDASVASERQAMQLTVALGARTPEHVDMGALYAEAAAWLVTALGNMGRHEEAYQAGTEALAVAEQVLQQRPGFRLALHAEQVITGGLENAALDDLNPRRALELARKEEVVSTTLLNLDPNNTTSINNLAVAHGGVGDSLWALGQLSESIPATFQSVEDFSRAAHGGNIFALVQTYSTAGLAFHQSQTGDLQGATHTVEAVLPLIAELRSGQPGSPTTMLASACTQLAWATIAYERGELDKVHQLLADSFKALRDLSRGEEQIPGEQWLGLYFSSNLAGHSHFLQGDFAAAEAEEREALKARTKTAAGSTGDRRDLGEISTWLTMALARQHKPEAAQTIGPVVALQRELASRNHGDRWQPFELACALYAQALTDPAHHAALLAEAARLIDGLKPSIRALRDVQMWRGFIEHEQHT